LSVAEAAIVLAHALVGWALCGATMGIAQAKTTLHRALAIHAVAETLLGACENFLCSVKAARCARRTRSLRAALAAGGTL